MQLGTWPTDVSKLKKDTTFHQFWVPVNQSILWIWATGDWSNVFNALDSAPPKTILPPALLWNFLFQTVPGSEFISPTLSIILIVTNSHFNIFPLLHFYSAYTVSILNCMIQSVSFYRDSCTLYWLLSTFWQRGDLLADAVLSISALLYSAFARLGFGSLNIQNFLLIFTTLIHWSSDLQKLTKLWLRSVNFPITK